MKLFASDSFRADGARFLLAGAINTGLSIVVYQLALFFFSPTISYALSWGVGLVFVYFVYPGAVFVGGRRDGRSRLLLILNYGVGFLIGLATISLFTRMFGADRLAIFLSILVTTSYNFVASRLVLRR